MLILQFAMLLLALSIWSLVYRNADMYDVMPVARPAGECNCNRASQENTKPAGSTCACGARAAGESSALPPSLPP